MAAKPSFGSPGILPNPERPSVSCPVILSRGSTQASQLNQPKTSYAPPSAPSGRGPPPSGAQASPPLSLPHQGSHRALTQGLCRFHPILSELCHLRPSLTQGLSAGLQPGPASQPLLWSCPSRRPSLRQMPDHAPPPPPTEAAAGIRVPSTVQHKSGRAGAALWAPQPPLSLCRLLRTSMSFPFSAASSPRYVVFSLFFLFAFAHTSPAFQKDFLLHLCLFPPHFGLTETASPGPRAPSCAQLYSAVLMRKGALCATCVSSKARCQAGCRHS